MVSIFKIMPKKNPNLSKCVEKLAHTSSFRPSNIQNGEFPGYTVSPDGAYLNNIIITYKGKKGN